jgi:hypothetical protein
MFRFLHGCFRSAGAKQVPRGRGRSSRLGVELLEGRLVPSTISAISWQSMGATHHALYAIGGDDGVYVSLDGGGYSSLGGYAKQIGAGLDASGNPDLYAIGIDDSIYYDDGPGFIDLGGYAKKISATTLGTVYAIGSDNSVWSYANKTGWVSLGGYALDISAGLDVNGNPEVYAIGSDNSLYVNDGNGFVSLGGYVKQISATVQGTVYAIGMDDAVYVNVNGSGFVDLGGYAKEISAGLDSYGNPELFAIGQDNSLYVNQGSGFVALGGYLRDIAAPAVGVAVPGDVVYGIAADHTGRLNQGGVYANLGGYIQLTTPPGGTITSVSWQTLSGATFDAVYTIGMDDAIYVSVNGGNFTWLGGYAKEVSAGVDANGNPEVYAIGMDDAVYVDNGSGFIDLGGYAKAISATAQGTLYAIGANNSVWAYSPRTGMVNLGGYALALSAGIDANGNPSVYYIGSDHSLHVDDSGGSIDLGGYVKQISATTQGTVYAIGMDDATYAEVNGGGFIPLGGYAVEISAGLDINGNPELFAIGQDDSLYVNHGNGFIALGGYLRDISAPAVGVAVPGDIVIGIAADHTDRLNDGGLYANLGGYSQG